MRKRKGLLKSRCLELEVAITHLHLGSGLKALEENNKVQDIKIPKKSAGSFQLVRTKTTEYQRVLRGLVKSEALDSLRFRQAGSKGQSKNMKH